MRAQQTLTESLLLSLAGAAIGTVASILLVFVKFSMMSIASFSQIVFQFEPTPTTLGWAVLAGAVMGIVGGFVPAFRAARAPLIDALRA
jgi:putative ABC transport system permease protein